MSQAVPPDIPYLSADQMRAVDRKMIEDYRIELTQMMENAGRNLADFTRRRFLNGDPRGKHVVCLAGTGGNGGDALVCARRLHTWGARVAVVLSRSAGALAPVPAHQLEILTRMTLPIDEDGATEGLDGSADIAVIVDGLIGYGLSGAPRGGAARLIRWANRHAAPILAVDLPSGLDGTTGAMPGETIRAVATVTLALPKRGLRAPAAADWVGELYVTDLSVPRELYASLDPPVQVDHLFARSEIVRL